MQARPWTWRNDAAVVPMCALWTSAAAADPPEDTKLSDLPGLVFNFAAAWEEHIRSGSMSLHALSLVRNVLRAVLATRGGETKDDDEDNGRQAAASEATRPVVVAPAELEQLLCRGDKPNVDLPQNARHASAMNLLDELWGSSEAAPLLAADAKAAVPGTLEKLEEHKAARWRLLAPDSMNEQGSRRNRSGEAFWYPPTACTQMWRWFGDLQMSAEPPTDSQAEFLATMLRRLQHEAAVEAWPERSLSQEPPLVHLVTGVPGCGKSRLIWWLRHCFEECFGWKHGREYICLAYQNSMASLIEGETIHSWLTLQRDGHGGPTDMQVIAGRVQFLRFCLVDEVSMIPAELLAQLESLVSRVSRDTKLFCKDTAGCKHLFGGCNVLLFGDEAQLPPVSETALWSDPAKAPSASALQGLRIVWDRPPFGVGRLWRFNKSMRCPDVWFAAVLDACRQGNLPLQMHALLHGYPTRQVTAQCVGCDVMCSCPDDLFGPAEGCRHWIERFLAGASGAELIKDECAACAARRQQCRRVLRPEELRSSVWRQPPFDTAPLLTSYNVPRFRAILLRAQQFADTHRRAVYWAAAHDRPLAAADLQLDECTLRQKRLRWLSRHDQETSHLASLLPLVEGLPVRLTEKVDKKLRLFKGKRGHIVSWTLEEGTVATPCQGGFVLSKQPAGIYVRFPDAQWQLAPTLARGTYLFTPATRSWLLCRRSGMSALRTGYFLVPDFATTAHMAQGQSLPALFCCVDTDPVAAYVMLSRTTDLNALAILRPFSSRLFRNGAPLGQQLLQRKFEEDWNWQRSVAEWARATCLPERRLTPTYICAECQLRGLSPCEHPWTAFGVETEAQIWAQGEWARCQACQSRHAGDVPLEARRTCEQSKAAPNVAWCAWCEKACTASQLTAKCVDDDGTQRKVRLCPDCTSCRQCGKRLRHMRNCRRGGENRCPKCLRETETSIQRLKQLWQLSRRKQCQCQKPVHTETCPMAPRQFGEASSDSPTKQVILARLPPTAAKACPPVALAAVAPPRKMPVRPGQPETSVRVLIPPLAFAKAPAANRLDRQLQDAKCHLANQKLQFVF
ncbi:esrp2 [Symbiodinium sp. CCMP2592]|nr:esrp2 [Symbiodinium sp. CCMP2592]